MFRRIFKILVLSTLLISSFITKTNAQETIAPEKRVLIKELLEVTEAKKMAENFTNTILLQMERNYPQMISQMMFEAGILKDMKQGEFQKKLIESQLRFSERFRELYSQRINLGQVMEQIYYPLYDKYFTEDELKDLIIFYKSPIGKKSIKVMPQLFQESMQKSSELLNPKIIQLIDEIMQEEKRRLLEVEKTTQEKKQ